MAEPHLGFRLLSYGMNFSLQRSFIERLGSNIFKKKSIALKKCTVIRKVHLIYITCLLGQFLPIFLGSAYSTSVRMKSDMNMKGVHILKFMTKRPDFVSKCYKNYRVPQRGTRGQIISKFCHIKCEKNERESWFGYLCPVIVQHHNRLTTQRTEITFANYDLFPLGTVYLFISLYWRGKHIQYLEVSNIRYLEIKLQFLWVYLRVPRLRAEETQRNNTFSDFFLPRTEYSVRHTMTGIPMRSSLRRVEI